MSATRNPAAIRRALNKAKETGVLVRVERDGVGNCTLDSFVLDVADEWVLLQPTRDRLDLDGYETIRLRDISSVRRSGKSSFLLNVLRAKKQFPKRPDVDLGSLQKILESAAAQFGVVVLSREVRFPDEVAVGRGQVFRAKTFQLRWLSPLAKWKNDARTYRIEDVTMVQFGGEYELTLWAHARKGKR